MKRFALRACQESPPLPRTRGRGVGGEGLLRQTLTLLLIVTLTIAAAPATDTAALLRDGNSAFRRGDYARAAELYERAGMRTTEPALVAFDLAVTKYRLALESADSRAKHLEEAAQYFRCCLAPNDPRRGRALHYLGACLLQQALDGDDSRVSEAVALLEACLRAPGLDEASADDARHNLALARLVSAQTPPASSTTQPQDPQTGDEKSTKPQPKERRRPGERNVEPGGDPTTGQTDPRTKSTEVKTDVNRPGNETKAGREQITHGPDAPTIDPSDARYLLDAFERINAERQAYKRKKALPPAPGVKDW